jgi:hypothetical protein
VSSISSARVVSIKRSIVSASSAIGGMERRLYGTNYVALVRTQNMRSKLYYNLNPARLFLLN